jgi:hypothetical protein
MQTSTYYGFSFRFCNIRKGNEKGHVERSVDYVRRLAFSGKDIFETEREAMERLLWAIERVNAESGGLEEEREGMLRAMPEYSSVERMRGLVDKWSTVVTGTNHYSVPDYLVGKEVDVHVHIDRIVIKYADKEVARHERAHGKNQFCLDIFHYRETLKRKPGALRSSLCLKQSTRLLREVFEEYFKEEPREFIALLEGFDEYDVFQIRQACVTLRECGARVRCDTLKMVLANKADQTPVVENGPDEVEAACLRELSLLADGRCTV